MVLLSQATPSAVRALRTILVAGSALVLATTTTGCSHRRTAMRPIFGSSVQATPVLTAPETAYPTAPAMITTPASAEPFLTPAPSAPSTSGAMSNGVIRAGGGTPPVPDAPQEPALLPPESSITVPTVPPSTTQGASYSRSSSLRGAGRQASTTTKRMRVTLRDQVKPYLENPEDLFAPPRADRPWKYVVLHHSAASEGGLDQIDRDHRKVLGFEGCGYHFVIGNGTDSPDGQIQVADRWLNQKNGVHCRNGKTPDVNEYGIGICLVGNFDRTAPTTKQVAAAQALVAYLGDRYRIETSHVGTHADFATGPTACPGKNFPTEAILGSAHLAQR